MPPSPVFAPGPALGARPRVALSSAQVFRLYPAELWPRSSLRLGRSAAGVGRRQFLSPGGPDCLRATNWSFWSRGAILRSLALPARRVRGSESRYTGASELPLYISEASPHREVVEFTRDA